ncbi:hypothetical protein EUGRSUZ_L01444 [Eucalyptus grandis]|uniref:Uncharacterized protein n=1 Tax=Eucalyptus grandis TaxID=71139 RepID=A0A058ZVD2_EUCGR|nr:hypothetical protein EUGRSUZ_L01444 [Eucalyptus grandis]
MQLKKSKGNPKLTEDQVVSLSLSLEELNFRGKARAFNCLERLNSFFELRRSVLDHGRPLRQEPLRRGRSQPFL